MKDVKKELIYDEQQWNRYYNEDILNFTDRFKNDDVYTKYPHTHRFKRCYNGKSLLSADSVYKPEKNMGVKFFCLMAIIIGLVFLGFLYA